MALERLTLTPVVLVGRDEDQLNKTPRLPRWTRQELLVLIQGKRVAENRVRRGRDAGGGQVVVEPKWSSVSSYCKRHGVNRGPVQCRKRWSNLAGDFKKIKEWESCCSGGGGKEESFWVMRNDLRRDRKLPGFFDREVYDILDDGGEPEPEPPSSVADVDAAAGDKSLILSLAVAPSSSEPQPQPDTEVVLDGGRTTDDGLFSDELPMATTPPSSSNKDDDPTPISATHYYDPPFSQTQPQAQTHGVLSPPSTEEDKETSNQKSPETYHQERKRKRPDTANNDDEMEQTCLQKQLIEAMERNGRLASSQLEIQNTNSQLDREQRKDHANTLFAVLNKLADAMVKIADKL